MFDLIPQLFRTEFSKMVSVISKRFGLKHIEMAEDIVSETFLQAAESWGMQGIPANPRAWLYTVAKNKTLYQFRRKKLYNEKILPGYSNEQETVTTELLNFSEANIKDSQLQMLFAICDPAIASEAQIGLALRILCGFGIEEIAEAFLSNKETINKRLFRAKEKLRSEHSAMEYPPEDDIPKRLDTVLHIIYLLFNEGYYSHTQDSVLRKDLCVEALRLALMLTEYPPTNAPKTNALIALMCFHASRFSAREQNEHGFILYDNQDKSLWDNGLILRGLYYLERSASGDELSSYHLEARIAYWHSVKTDSPEKWQEILALYNELLLVNYSPSVALNRIVAIYKVQGAQAAITESRSLGQLDHYFYYILMGELFKEVGDHITAITFFEEARELARTPAERQTLKAKIIELYNAPGWP